MNSTTCVEEPDFIRVLVLCEVFLPIEYGPIILDEGYRVDMLIGDLVIVENKTVDTVLPIHAAQLLTYLKMKKLSLGYLLNWNVPLRNRA